MYTMSSNTNIHYVHFISNVENTTEKVPVQQTQDAVQSDQIDGLSELFYQMVSISEIVLKRIACDGGL